MAHSETPNLLFIWEDDKLVGVSLMPAQATLPAHNSLELELVRVFADLAGKTKECEQWAKLAKARDDMLTCYRIGKRPSEKLFDSLEKGSKFEKQVLKKEGAKDGT